MREVTIEEQHDAFMGKLRELLHQHMPEDWHMAFMIVIPDPTITEKDAHHVFWHTDMEEVMHKWAVYEWALRLHEGTVEVDDLKSSRAKELRQRSDRRGEHEPRS